MKMSGVLETLQPQVKSILQICKKAWHQSGVIVENDIEDFQEIYQLIKDKKIIFQSNDECGIKNSGNHPTTCDDTQRDAPKKRGRKTKTSSVSSESKNRSDSSDSRSLNDSTSSTRSRRAAAQAAEHKLAQVQSLVLLNTKLRRPTNYGEKPIRAASSPPSKCRRTRRNQSAGSCSSPTDEVIEDTNKNNMVIDCVKLGDDCLNIQCSVNVQKLNTPTIKSFTDLNRSRSKSLDRACKRKSEDLFDDDDEPLSELNSKQAALSSDRSRRSNKKKFMSKKDVDSGISSTQEELEKLGKTNLPIAQSSPIISDSTDDVFRGFDDDQRQVAEALGNTFVIGIEAKQSQKITKTESQESSCEEAQLIETNISQSKSKVLKKKGTQTTVNIEEKENVNRNNETQDSPNLRSQIRVMKKDKNHVAEKRLEDKKSSETDSESSPEKKARSRTKTIRKNNENIQELKSDSEATGQTSCLRTKTIKKNNEEVAKSDSTDDEQGNIRSRTKVIKKGPTNLVKNVLESECLVSQFKDDIPSAKINRLPPKSPAPAKGELVKKRIEDFEKMQNGSEGSDEEQIGSVRVTRNAMKNKAAETATEAQGSKEVRKMMQLPASLKRNIGKSVDKGKRDKVKEEKENVPVAKLMASGAKQPMSSERARMTPLGVNNRMTPSSDSAHKPQANKWTSSVNRPTPAETTGVMIQKQAADDADRKRKEDERLKKQAREEERLKRQAKEEEAKRKKEKVLKATAEEAKRKRLEKLQKAAAAREAAEKEKERLAAKAEKEKQEKMRQNAIEREKLKEEQLKKKQLMHQKALEHEERRKQEEAARLAKIKEQEEEQKRLQAMKEREQELLRQQKAELRLAEAEKIKHQGGKLGKIAAVNHAKLKIQQGGTPSEKQNGAQTVTSYEITPAREDRPLLPPKTENDYGIDDAHSGDSSDDESQPKKMIPSWAQPKNRERILAVNQYIPKKLWDLFMVCDPNPDIYQMFAGNPIKKRLRTSSAVWRTPPKYS